jgi:hypothetical protein
LGAAGGAFRHKGRLNNFCNYAQKDFSLRNFHHFSVELMLIMTNNAKLLAILLSHANLYGEALTHVLPQRVITYRRFWSRIERASARLQGEWGVQAGQCVAYVGNGHPDALVLYFALIRIGARLLPLEGLSATQIQQAMTQADVACVMVDDALDFADTAAHALSELLADWSHFDPQLVAEDPAMLSLLLPVVEGAVLSLQPVSLLQLLHGAARSEEVKQAVLWVPEKIFTIDTLSTLVLPALSAAQHLCFVATDKALRKAS